LGSITNADSRKLNVPLSFLDKNVKYKAKIFKDGKNADFEKNPYPVEILEMEVDSKTVLPISLARSGGTAVIFVKS
jgi:alpha-glucosidase